MATCPNCGSSSRVDPEKLKFTEILIAKPIGDFSLAGQQMKVSAVAGLQLSCECGWSIQGYVEGDDFIGDPQTQVFPAQ